MLKERNEPIPPEDLKRVVREIKEKYGYCVQSGDLLQEFKKFDLKNEADKKFRTYYGKNS